MVHEPDRAKLVGVFRECFRRRGPFRFVDGDFTRYYSTVEAVIGRESAEKMRLIGYLTARYFILGYTNEYTIEKLGAERSRLLSAGKEFPHLHTHDCNTDAIECGKACSRVESQAMSSRWQRIRNGHYCAKSSIGKIVFLRQVDRYSDHPELRIIFKELEYRIDPTALLFIEGEADLCFHSVEAFQKKYSEFLSVLDLFLDQL